MKKSGLIRVKLPHLKFLLQARNPLQLESANVRLSLVPWRMLELELTSFTASSMAILETLPMEELNVNIAPILTTSGLEETFLPYPLENTAK